VSLSAAGAKSGKEVVVSSGGKIELAQRAAVNRNDVVEPQGQVRKVFC
jgi:hypothetical protein